MSLNRSEKEAVISEVTSLAAKAQTLVIAEYRGITVTDMTKLRSDARSKGVYLRKVAVSSTMGVGVRVDTQSIAA